MKDKFGNVKNGYIKDTGDNIVDDENKNQEEEGQAIIASDETKKDFPQAGKQPQSDFVHLEVTPYPSLLFPLGDGCARRKLIIHLDIRNTILVTDSVTNVFVEEALNSFLTGVVWGSEVDGEWKWHSAHPSLKSPAPGLSTYYKYLEKKLVKNTTDRVNLRLQTGDFAYTALGKCFRKHFDVHLQRLSWQYGTSASHDKVLTMAGRDGKSYHYILPSVYKLLHHLTNEKRDFAVVIRTYGRDAPNALSSLSNGIRGTHPGFTKPLNIKVCKNPGKINRKRNEFELLTCSWEDRGEVPGTLKREEDIYHHLSSSQGIVGYVDDFLYWQKKNYDHAAGKPMWIDPHDQRHHHIFFDDNFRADDEDSIIDVRVFNNDNPRTSRSLEHSELVHLEDVFLVQADLLQSINDEEYFIHKIETCERNFENFRTSKLSDYL